jgi:hypothetical protein
MKLVGVTVAAVLLLTAQQSEAQEPTTVTGCINQLNVLVRVAVGDEPAQPCGANQTEVTFQLSGGTSGGGLSPVPFYAEASLGETIPILTHGPMTLSLRCFTSGGKDVAALSVVSTEDDMLVTGEVSALQLANDSATLFYGSVVANDGAGYVSLDPALSSFFEGRASGGSAITPDGFVISVPDSASFGIGTARFSATPHAWESAPDCFVVGAAFLQQVPLDLGEP